MMKIFKHASLCSGIGAAELAASWMGWKNEFSVEIDDFCNKVLKYHYPNAVHYGNIFEQDFREWRGRVDVLTAGFPCQPFSCAGKRNGAEDDRYLWPEVLRVINEVRPTWFIGENVGGIITMVLPGEETKVGSYTDVCGENYTFYEKRQRFVIEQIRIDLASIGYSVQPVVIPACAVGAPHRRDRVWFLARRDDVTDTDGAGLQETGTQQRATGVAGDGLQGSTPHSKSDGSYRTPGTAGKKTERSDWKEIKQSIVWREIRTSSNPSKQGFQERVNDGKREVAEETRTREDDGLERLGGKQITTYSQRVGSDKIHENLQLEQPNGAIVDSIGGERYDRRCIKIPDWQNFPATEPAIRRGDDGGALGLSGITFSRWRQESIKALGNSMVAPLVYEIFLAIEQVEQIK
jgi:DNA (cytosine-5)-methyltransferase 1